MKILFLNNFYYLRGGSERVLFDEMRLLREAGHEVAIYSRGHEKNEPAEFARFFPAPLETERFGLSCASVRTVKELIYSSNAREGLREVIKCFNPDIAHAHNIYGRLSLSVLDELKSTGVPVVMTLHDLKMLCPSYLMLNKGKVCELCKGGHYANAFLTRCHKGSYPASFVYALESWINHTFGKYDSVHRFITPSRFLRDKCVEYGCDEVKIEYIPNFVDPSWMAECPAGGEYLLYMGRLSREKGINTLLRAYGHLKSPIPLKIIGEGPERRAFEREASDAGLQATFTGYLGGSQLKEALAGSRVVVVPSECYENAPMSILEAMAHGKPVIGARIGGIPEMIDDGVTGYLFEPGNAADLQCKLEQFLSLPDAKVAEMGSAARQKVAKEHDAAGHFAVLMQIYLKALNGIPSKSVL